MNTIETLDAISAANNDCSDYRISKLMEVTKQTVSMWRTTRQTMSPDLRIRAAKLLNQDPSLHLMYSELERAKSPQQRDAWQSAVSRLTACFIAGILAAGMTYPALQEATHCILCKIRKRLQKTLPDPLILAKLAQFAGIGTITPVLTFI